MAVMRIKFDFEKQNSDFHDERTAQRPCTGGQGQTHKETQQNLPE